MEPRHWVAFGIIALVSIAGTAALIVKARQRARRRLRLRGIKTYEHRRAHPARGRETAG